MSPRFQTFALVLPVILSALALSAPRLAQAAVPDSVIALAGPLAEQYGVSGSAVTSLLKSGINLDTVTQLLLVKQAAGKSLDQVTDLYREGGDDVRKAADQLGVAASSYSPDKVNASLDRAKKEAADVAAKKAADSAGKAIGGFLKGK
jgi:hypothetical protein